MGRPILNPPQPAPATRTSPTAPRRDRRGIALWAAWLVGMSPLLATAPTWLGERPESLYVVFAPLLLLWETVRARHRDRQPQPSWGVLLVLVSMPALLTGLETGSPTLGLGGAALAFIGVAAWTGRPPPVVSALALWIVPVPVFLLDGLSPGLETLWMDGVVTVARGLGVELTQIGPVAFGPTRTRVEFFPVDDGLLLAHGMALVGYFHALRRGDTPRASARRGFSWMAVGFALQGVVLLGAVLAAGRGDVDGVREALVHGPTLLIALGLGAVILTDAFAARRRTQEPVTSRV